MTYRQTLTEEFCVLNRQQLRSCMQVSSKVGFVHNSETRFGRVTHVLSTEMLKVNRAQLVLVGNFFHLRGTIAVYSGT